MDIPQSGESQCNLAGRCDVEEYKSIIDAAVDLYRCT